MEEGKLHEDIVVEILCRLPKKSLARFKCVSKRWCNLISDRHRVFPKATHVGFVRQIFLPPQFYTSGEATSQVTEHRSLMSFFHVCSDGTASLARSHLTDIEESCLLLSSCNGFLLFRKEPAKKRLDDEEKYIVCHPATKRSWAVTPTWSRNAMHVGLASDGQHFNFVRIFPIMDETGIGMDVYSSEEEDWRRDPLPPTCDIPPYDPENIETGHSVFLHGALHWIWRNFLLIYHLESEDCEILNLPRVPNKGRRRERQDHCIWDSEGCLNYCRVFCSENIGIWSLHRVNWSSKRSKYSFRWKVKHKGTLAAPLFVEIEHSRSFSPIAFNDEFGLVYLIHGRKVFSFNVSTGELKEACMNPPFEGSDDRALCIAFPFLYLTQFDIEAMTNGDGELCNF